MDVYVESLMIASLELTVSRKVVEKNGWMLLTQSGNLSVFVSDSLAKKVSVGDKLVALGIPNSDLSMIDPTFFLGRSVRGRVEPLTGKGKNDFWRLFYVNNVQGR